ncbi:hypothetical protein AB4Y36_37755 [Paraburkholderia sp. BR10936]|uniref:hypothetical protein n=1 Tax=Paraburkholderia sp. BR10936 TaxID=3236993 RepID=UPI0034D32BC3
MERTYKYKGFAVTVILEPVWEASGNVTLLPAHGYVPIVHIKAAGAIRPFVPPIRLAGDGKQPFPTQAEALMAGFSAGQRLIDDTLAE